MNKQEIKNFAERDWKKISEIDQNYWADQYKHNGPEASRKASDMLWEHMKSIQPEWPDISQREADIQHHIHLKQLLDKASNGLKSR